MSIRLFPGPGFDPADLNLYSLRVRESSSHWFTFLVPAYPGSPGRRAIKRTCVCVCVCLCVCVVCDGLLCHAILTVVHIRHAGLLDSQ